jgi:hypothetical protein
MSKRDDIQLVLDMIESCERIHAYTAGSTGFESQRMEANLIHTQDAKLALIGL